MAKTDWRFTDTVIPEDLNSIGEDINGLRTELSTRFDHEATTPLTLEPGLQVVHAAKSARFKLGEIRGRTLVNLLGQMGSMDSLNGWRYDPDAAVLDSTDKIEGMASVKGIISNGQYSDIFYSFPYESSKRYVALGELKTYGGATARIRMVESEGLVELSSPLLSSNIFSTAFFKVPLNAITSDNTVYFGTVFAGENGSGGNIDALRVYEISDAEYQALDDMTPQQVALKYPFVPGGIVGVENPYVINTSGNLLPPFYEWTIVEPDKVKIQAPYTLSLTNGTVGATIYTDLPAKSGDIFTLHGQIEDSNVKGYLTVGFYKDNELLTWGLEIYSNSDPASFICPDGTTSIKIVCAVQESNLNTITYIKPTLSVGSEFIPFREQHKSMLAFKTELYANPEGSNDPDILFEQGGEYWKLRKWKKIILDESLDWKDNSSGLVGYKKVITPIINMLPSVYITKFNGATLLPFNGGEYGPDKWFLNTSTKFFEISIANVDSGWGDDYTPEPDEIRAYFNGWVMMNSDTWNTTYELYNGAGNKGWAKRYVGVGTPVNTSTVGVFESGTGIMIAPTEIINNFWTPYQLLYRLAKETVEPVVTEGSLLLSEGDNMVEIGTGIILQERANPSFANQSGYYVIANNGFGASGNYLKDKPFSILNVFKSDREDKDWTIRRNFSEPTSQGLSDAYTTPTNFDPFAAYSVTYIKLDKSPIQPIIGTLAANEKAQISDLTASVTEALQRMSVVEQKKAEKDVHGWITPTLLNGWEKFGSPWSSLKYYKDSSNIVTIRGRVRNGTLGMFILPKGYRPSSVLGFPILCFDSSSNIVPASIMVRVSGEVEAWHGTINTSAIIDISFLAEQ